MHRRPPHLAVPLLLLVAVLTLFGCGPYFQSSRTEDAPPTPILSGVNGGMEVANVFTDPAAFQDALLKALSARDEMTLQAWMTNPFLTGTWRADLSDTSPADALKTLYTEELGPDSHLGRISFGEVRALMGDMDPLSIPRREAGVTNAFLVGGWGKDGRDEAILFVARQSDNSLKLHGWIVIKGGFSGAQLGGVRPYENQAQGYRVFLPKGYETDASGNQVSIVAPIEEGEPGLAIISAEPAKGRTTEQVASQIVKAAQAQLGPGANIKSTSIKIENAQAVIVTGLPGQDLNRQLFMVRGDLLYHILFIPDDPASGKAYGQMQALYAMIVNTFHFTKAPTGAPTPTTAAVPTKSAPTVAWKSFTSPKYGYVIAYPSEMTLFVENTGSVGDALLVERVILRLPNNGAPYQSSALTIEAAQRAFSRPVECQNQVEVIEGIQGCRRSLPPLQGTSQELVWFRVPAPSQGQLYFSMQLIYDDVKYATAFAHMLDTFKYSGMPATATPASSSNCSYKATFLGDVTIPDNSVVAPGASFTKTWRVRNDGTCPWGSKSALRRLVFVSGDQLGSPNSIELPFPSLGQGGTADVSIPVTAPLKPGTYQSNWRLQADDGTPVGFGPNGEGLLTVRIVVRVAGTAAPTAKATKNYTSAKYGYTVNYPAEWTVKVQNFTPAGLGRDPEVVLLTAPNAMGVTVQIYALKGAPPMQGYDNCKNMTFNGVPACEIIKSDGPVPQRSLVFQKGDAYFLMDCRYTTIEQLDQYEQMVLSFQFTP